MEQRHKRRQKDSNGLERTQMAPCPRKSCSCERRQCDKLVLGNLMPIFGWRFEFHGIFQRIVPCALSNDARAN